MMSSVSVKSIRQHARFIQLRQLSNSTATHPPLNISLTLPNGVNYSQPTGLFIDNQFVKGAEAKTFETINPATEKTICHIYEARQDDVEKAVQAASRAFKSGSWSKIDPSVRAQCLMDLATQIEAEKEIIASIESLDNGKAINSARGDVQLVVNYLKYTAGLVSHLDGRVIDTGRNSHFSFTRRQPLGVCAQIIPWNFPLLMWAWKIAPALITGNTVVLKTAESTPLSALYVSQFLEKAGIPAGVVNILSGFGKITGEALTTHPLVKKIAFTGSTATGKHIYGNAAKSLKKCTLELGGKSPNIVLNDANLDVALQNVITGIFFNSGEVCCAGSRVYVQEEIYDKFVAALKHKLESFKVGDPFDESTFQGAQTSQMQLNKILKYIKLGKQEGATVLTGGERLNKPGFFIKPTVFTNVKEDMHIVKEEIFGPVMTITKFNTLDEVIDMANDSAYGLAAGIHTTNINSALKLADDINAGTVWVNTYNDFHHSVPFGGFNDSGLGRELGIEALSNYTQVKAVRIKLEQ